MKFVYPTFILLFGAHIGYGCTTCNQQLRSAINNSTIYINWVNLLAAFIALAIIITLLARGAIKQFPARQQADLRLKEYSAIPVASSAMVLGIGLGGFIDGIVFHQILQWHEMLSARIPTNTLLNKSVNMFWDGIFHSFTLITTILGIYLLWRVMQINHINKSGKLLAGGMIIGWGIFNIVEGVINHHLLKLHNVKEAIAGQQAWNYSFLATGLLLIFLGYLLIQAGRKPIGKFSQYAMD